MAAPKLTDEQQDYLRELLAAEYSTAAIRHLLRQSEKDALGTPIGPDITRQNIHEYRKRYGRRIKTLRAQRRVESLERGIAHQGERVARLVDHADELEQIKWQPDLKTGRLWNEKAWRETLRQIAEEKGELAQKHELTGKDGERLIFTLNLDNPNDAGS